MNSRIHKILKLFRGQYLFILACVFSVVKDVYVHTSKDNTSNRRKKEGGGGGGIHLRPMVRKGKSLLFGHNSRHLPPIF